MAEGEMAARLHTQDIGLFWASLVFCFLLLTGSFRFSLVVSIFGVVNFFILVYWFSLPIPDPEQLRHFVDGLRVGAHRGLAADAPENTLSAIKLSKKLGADSVEFDLEFTSDGVPILLHDDTVDRTTDGEGPIGEMTWDQVKSLNAAAKFNNRSKFPLERVPRLEEAIQLCLDLKLKILIDVKTRHPKLIPVLTDLFSRHSKLYQTAAVCSFWPRVVYEVKRADSNILTGHTWRPGFFAFEDFLMTTSRFPNNPLKHLAAAILDDLNRWFLHAWMWKFTGASLILAQQREISANYISMWRDRGFQVVAWTVNSKIEREFFLKGLHSPFLTDRLSDMQDVMEELANEEASSDYEKVEEEEDL